MFKCYEDSIICKKCEFHAFCQAHFNTNIVLTGTYSDCGGLRMAINKEQHFGLGPNFRPYDWNCLNFGPLCTMMLSEFLILVPKKSEFWANCTRNGEEPKGTILMSAFKLSHINKSDNRIIPMLRYPHSVNFYLSEWRKGRIVANYNLSGIKIWK